MRGREARSFIYAAAWGAALLPACGVDAAGLRIDDAPEDGGARASGHASDGGGADSFLLDVVTLPGSDASFVDVANDAGQEAATLDAPHGSQLDAPPDAVDCDQDGDGWLAMGGGCNGEDCCDSDPNAHPEQTAFFTRADRCDSFDYDCNGVVTPEYNQVSCQLAIATCTGDGFDQPQACGVTASFEHCAPSVLGCFTMNETKTQGCR
jgi:hypothetical protein